MNRRSLIALASVVGLITWSKPIIGTIILPAHAQTSCPSINDVSVIGQWTFTDQNSVTVDIEFIDEQNLVFDNQGFNDPWGRSPTDGTLVLDIRSPRAPWQATITQEDNCVASEITITVAPTLADTYAAPLVGIRN